MLGAIPLIFSACQATGLNPSPNTGLAFSARPSLTSMKSATFSKPNVPDAKGPPGKSWIFASNGEGANVDVYDEATHQMISTCPCTGVGLAVDPTTGDLAVGSRSGVVTVWHVSGKSITQFATLKLSQGPYAIGLAYDGRGNLYAGNVGQNVIDFFSASEIAAGGGDPTRSVSTSNLVEIYYLAAPGKMLLADGYDMNGQPILVSVNLASGGDTVLQKLSSFGTLAEGIAVDRRQHLIVNAAGNSNLLMVFKKPWTGSPVATFAYGSGESSYYTGISLNRRQNTLWAANYALLNPSHAVANVQANSYPLGSLGPASTPVPSEFYDSVALDPQAKR